MPHKALCRINLYLATWWWYDPARSFSSRSNVIVRFYALHSSARRTLQGVVIQD